ncbi:MAG: dihydropteroate synthase [Rhodospirillales bacterium]|jgi:dihydropteroate synthase|nr:dihydropteroate synthase [Rhodospirillales bacterium]
MMTGPENPALPRGFPPNGKDAAATVYLRPLGSPDGFQHCEVLIRRPGGTLTVHCAKDDVVDWARAEGGALANHISALIGRLAAPRPPFAGLALDRPLIMGIINVTPDSFSDGGETPDTASAVARGRAMAEAGADILDVGGESTRPGSRPLSADEELARVVPVVRALAGDGHVVSIDSRRARVMEAALDAGAVAVNDITALNGDEQSLAVVAERAVPVILMHMQGRPQTMQENPRYDHAALDIYDELGRRVEACLAAGIPRAAIAIDPGIGFGKTVHHNAEILGRLSLFHGHGCAVALGVSRKSFIAALGRGEPVTDRLAGSLAAALHAVGQGVHILRVHDVAETRQAFDVWRAIEAARSPHE